MFYFIRKKIVVDCFTAFPRLIEEFPFERAIKSTPTWWRKLARTYQVVDPFLGTKNTMRSMKTCSGFTELFANAWVYRLWADYQIVTDESGAYRYTGATEFAPPIRHHPVVQYGDSFNQFIHCKIETPWLLFEKTGVKFAYIANDWELLVSNPDLRVVSGVLDFKNNHHPNVNLFLPRKTATHQLPAGLPFVHIIPLTEKAVEFRMHHLTDAEFTEKRKQTIEGKMIFQSRVFDKTTL